jgi:hypothetical protein
VAVRVYRDSKRIRDVVGVFAYFAAGALCVYVGSFLVGHPPGSWGRILDDRKVPLIASAVAGVIGKGLHWRTVVPIADDTQRSVTLANAASELSDFLYRQASRELDMRGLDRSALLEVRWQPKVQRIGAVGLADHGPPVRTTLAGVAARFVADGLSRVMVIGSDASGKSAVALHLQRGLLDMTAQARGEPFQMVPVVLPLAGWHPGENLERWAAGRLREIHPALAFRVRIGRHKLTIADGLLARQRVLLILDGLDELHERWQWEAFVQVNARMGRGLPLIVTCRAETFARNLPAMFDVAKPDDHGVPRGPAIVELLAPELASVETYLKYFAAADKKEEVWDEALKSTSSTVLAAFREAWRSPLMVWLTAQVFRSEPERFQQLVEDPDGGPDTREKVEEHLLGNLVEKAIEHDRGQNERRKRADGNAAREYDAVTKRYVAEAKQCLTFLAAWVTPKPGQGTVIPPGKTYDIAWWRLADQHRVRRVMTAYACLMALLSGAAVAVGVGLALWKHQTHTVAVTWSAISGVVFTIGLGFLYVKEKPPPKTTQFKRTSSLREPLRAGFYTCAVASPAGYFLEDGWLGMLWGPGVAFFITLAYAYSSPTVDPEKVESPIALYRLDQQHTYEFSFVYGVPLGVMSGFYYGWPLGVTMGVLAAGIGGFSYGLIELAVYERKSTGLVAWLRFRVAHFWLWRRRVLPFELFTVLEHMHRLGILRQNGGHYVFNHRRLREQLVEDYYQSHPEADEYGDA